MATDCITQVTFQGDRFAKRVVARFDQPDASTDGGLVLLKALDTALGLTARLAACVDDAREPGKVRHETVAWGGWTTFGTTQTKTKEAVLASQAAICVAQFMKQPDHEAKLKELEAIGSWQRAEVIEKGSWDKMPGQEKADYAVARACADGLELLFKK